MLIPCRECVREFGHPEHQPKTKDGLCKHHKKVKQAIEELKGQKCNK